MVPPGGTVITTRIALPPSAKVWPTDNPANKIARAANNRRRSIGFIVAGSRRIREPRGAHWRTPERCAKILQHEQTGGCDAVRPRSICGGLPLDPQTR